MISKTKLFQRIEKKRNPEIIETIIACKKNGAWLKIGQIISNSRKKMPVVNLFEIEKESRDGDLIIVPGKVLGNGEITKKIRIAAMNFSESAREKLSKHKSEIVTILEEIKKNPKAGGMKILQ